MARKLLTCLGGRGTATYELLSSFPALARWGWELFYLQRYLQAHLWLKCKRADSGSDNDGACHEVIEGQVRRG